MSGVAAYDAMQALAEEGRDGNELESSGALTELSASSPRVSLRRVITAMAVACGVSTVFVVGLLVGFEQGGKAVHSVGNPVAGSAIDGLQQKAEVPAIYGTVWMGFKCTQTQSGTGWTTDCDPKCFPGEAIAQVREGKVPVRDLKVGSEVLVSTGEGDLTYEPVLGFLHYQRGQSDVNSTFVTIVHDHGVFRASAGHIVFVRSGSGQADKTVGDLRIGDEIYDVTVGSSIQEATVAPSKIQEVRVETTTSGMFAPLTRSGTVVIDGTLASIYASPNGMSLPHSAVHATTFFASALV